MANFNEDVMCPVAATLEYIGGRWKTIILYYLSSGKKRFGEIAARIPTISRKVLTQQLKELESDGLITRKEYKEIPPHVEYSLTELGTSLSSVFKEMSIWGKKNILGKKGITKNAI
jgi:DNA-binding HxlR family transcriptional regulator